MPRRPNASPQTEQVLAVLLADPEGWRHGYDLSGETDLRSGTLYPILMRLERQGWLEARWEESPAPGKPRRHLYRLSAAGIREAQAAIARGRADVRVSRRVNAEGAAD